MREKAKASKQSTVQPGATNRCRGESQLLVQGSTPGHDLGTQRVHLAQHLGLRFASLCQAVALLVSLVCEPTHNMRSACRRNTTPKAALPSPLPSVSFSFHFNRRTSALSFCSSSNAAGVLNERVRWMGRWAGDIGVRGTPVRVEE